MEYLADTIVVIRHFSKSGSLSRNVRSVLNGVSKGTNRLLISVISFVEILYLSEKNRININFDELKNRIEPLDNYEIIDLSVDIIETAKKVQGLELHDRLIVATAKYFNIPILTSDQEIRKYKGIESIWD